MKLIFVVGPTASGKSQWAIEAAEKLSLAGHKAEILNADSIQMYQGLEIGSAKPSQQDRQRITHHLLDFVPKGQSLSAGDFRRIAIETMNARAAAGLKALFVVGGSGFYLQALEKGMFDRGKVPESIHLKVQEEAAKDLLLLYGEIQAVDPEFCKKISPNDSYRISRAVEVLRAFGVTPSEIRKNFAPEPLPFPIKKLGLVWERKTLEQRITLRTRNMIQDGLLQEVQALLGEGLSEWAPLASIGYRETIQFLSQQSQLKQTIELENEIIMNSMRLAKKQMTWFRRDLDIQWLHGPACFDWKSKAMEHFFATILQHVVS